MTTLFKAITRTTPMAINQNRQPQNPAQAVTESYTRLIIRDFVMKGSDISINLTASITKPKNWADKNTLSCQDLVTIINGFRDFSGSLEIMAERIAIQCLSYETLRDVTIRIEQQNMGVEIFRQ